MGILYPSNIFDTVVSIEPDEASVNPFTLILVENVDKVDAIFNCGVPNT